MRHFSWIKYLIIGFILIALYNANNGYIKDLATKTSRIVKSLGTSDTPLAPQNKNNEPHNSTIPFSVQSKEDSIISKLTVNLINKVLDNPHGRIVFEDLVNKMVTNYHGTLGEDIVHKEFIAKDIVIGSGKTAQCGDKISIRYNIQKSSEQDNNSDNTILKDLYIGDAAINRSLENALIGMKEKGKRKIMFNDEKTHSDNISNNKKDFLLADVTMEKVITKNNNQNDWGIFIDKDSFSFIGPKIMCGDEISAYYSMRNLQGKQIYNSKSDNKTITFKIGDSRTPTKISQGLIGLVKNQSKISLIMKQNDLLYTDRKGNRILPNNIQVEELIILELDTKV
ncbi:MAG: hypothetical protein K0T99_04240 [Alphaproteobacteria bacterium]|nr:hypothetical protein [Alphaproteobacteria bacterium]